MKVSQDGRQSPPNPSRTLNMGPHQHVLRVARAAISGLMGSVDDVWLVLFVREFLNNLARAKDDRQSKVSRSHLEQAIKSLHRDCWPYC